MLLASEDDDDDDEEIDENDGLDGCEKRRLLKRRSFAIHLTVVGMRGFISTIGSLHFELINGECKIRSYICASTSFIESPGFIDFEMTYCIEIRNEEFDLKTWVIPGTNSGYEVSSWKRVYIGATRKIKSKVVADVVEALIGAYLVAGGEKAALSFMAWLGISVDFVNVPYMRTFNVKAEEHINVNYLESLLRYKFHDASLLVEALTHGSYMRPEIPGCYQRLEFLGDAVLDYLMTLHLYNKYDGLSPGLLTDLRSASVNNDCYALSAIRAGLYKHILHLSPDLNRHIGEIVRNSNESISIETFGWESEITLPKVLGDVIESIAGAIYVDSGCDKERVFKSMRPLLEPLITLETLRLHPIRELNQLCQKMHYHFDKPVVSRENGMAYVTVEVEAQGVVHKASRSASDRKLAQKLACRDVLKSLKESSMSQ